MQVVVSHVCWEAIVSLCVNAGVVTASHQMTTVDYDVGQWSSRPTPPPHWTFWPCALWVAPFRATGLWRGRLKKAACVYCHAERMSDVTNPCRTIGLVECLLLSWEERQCSLYHSVATLHCCCPLWSPPKIKLHYKLSFPFMAADNGELTWMEYDPLMEQQCKWLNWIQQLLCKWFSCI